MRRVLCLCLWAWISVASASAQPVASTVIAIAPRSMFADALADRIRAGVTTDHAMHVEVLDLAPPCEPSTSTQQDTRLSIAIASDTTVVICAQSEGGFSQRRVGPFAPLDATAAEQIATMVEATLEALAQPLGAAPAADTHARDSDAATARQDAPGAADVGAEAEARDGATPTAPAGGGNQPEAQARPSALNEVAAVQAATAQDAGEAMLQSSRFALRADLGATLWDARTLAADLRVAARYAVAARWAWLQLGLHYGLPFTRTIESLGARFSLIAVELAAVVALPVSERMTVDVVFGPRVEWLLVRPFVAEGGNATAGEDSYAFNISAVVEVSPRVQLHEALWLSLTVGATFVSDPRAYGVYRDTQFSDVLDQSIPRPHLLVGALLAL